MVKLTVSEDEKGANPNGQPLSYSKESILSEDSYIFNLNKDDSKLFVGGLPSTFQAQKGISELSLEGQVEDLMIGTTPIGLWNYVDSVGVEGATERYSVTFINYFMFR